MKAVDNTSPSMLDLAESLRPDCSEFVRHFVQLCADISAERGKKGARQRRVQVCAFILRFLD